MLIRGPNEVCHCPKYDDDVTGFFAYLHEVLRVWNSSALNITLARERGFERNTDSISDRKLFIL